MKIINFGVFIGLEDGFEGLFYIFEFVEYKVDNLEEIVNVGDEFEVKIFCVDMEEWKIGFLRKCVEWSED